MNAVEKIQLAARQARRAYAELKEKRDEEKRKRLSLASEAINSDLANVYGEKLSALYDAQLAAEQAERDALTTRALSGEGAPFPLGTKMAEWSRGYSHSHALKLTGKVGVIEAVTEQSEFPENMGSWRRPAIGSFVIRMVKKDGSKSLKTVSAGGSDFRYYWRPEGVDPNTEKKG